MFRMDPPSVSFLCSFSFFLYSLTTPSGLSEIPRGGAAREALLGILCFLFVMFVHTHTFMVQVGLLVPAPPACALTRVL